MEFKRNYCIVGLMLIFSLIINGSNNPLHVMVPGDENWIPFGEGGLNGEVCDMATDGYNVYVVGEFTQAGSVSVSHLVMWNGFSWSNVGNAAFNGTVRAVAAQGNNVYVGGDFTTVNGITVNGIARWNGSQWSAMGTGVNTGGHIRAIEIDGSDVYVGGIFGSVDGVSTFSVAKWNGSTWSGFSGYGLYEWYIEDIEIIGSMVYVAGGSPPYPLSINYIKMWNGSDWEDVGGGTDGPVYALATDGTNLYAGGKFSMAGSVMAQRIARWNGSQWFDIGGGVLPGYLWDEDEDDYVLTSSVHSILIDGSDIYIGGEFGQVGLVESKAVAKWTGSQWINMGADAHWINAMVKCSGNLYVGGIINSAAGMDNVGHIMMWNGSVWKSMGNGLNGSVYALALGQDGIYAGGEFTAASGKTLNHAGKWDGNSWQALSWGVDGEVYAIATMGNNVYVAGSFVNATSVTANNIACWNGLSWQALGSGINGRINALASDGTYLYAGGVFTQAGGVPANNIARWNGTSWSAMGDGIQYPQCCDACSFPFCRGPEVLAIACKGNNVYVGGCFTQPGGCFCKWNGSEWMNMGSFWPDMDIYGGVVLERFYNPYINSIAVLGSNIYVSGRFEYVGSDPADSPYITSPAKWDGSQWSSFRPCNDTPIPSYCVLSSSINNNVFIGDWNYGLTTHQIVQWDGNDCSVFGSGVNNRILSIVQKNDLVYVGGEFTEAGGKPSGHLAAWYVGGGGSSGPVQFTGFLPVSSGPVVSDGGSSLGCAWADMDKDGDPDLFIANDSGENNCLYRNDGGGTFTKITTGPVVSDAGWSWAGAWGDIDNDDDPDLYVANFISPNFLYENNGDGTFTKIITGAPVTDDHASQGCAWADIDNDGDLDLFVANGSAQNNDLYLNDGNGTFTAVTTGPVVSDGGNSVTGVFADADNDGDQDLFVANKGGENNFFYTNDGNGSFTKITTGEPVTDGGESWTASWGDADNDGDQDLFVGNNAEANFFYINQGNAAFSKVTAGSIVTGMERSRSSTWGDVNNDGTLDLIVSNKGENSYVYLNEGALAFSRYYTASANSRGVALCDYDGDGDQDLCAVNNDANNFLYLNLGNAYHWVKIKCEGTVSNHSAIGARIRIQAALQGTPVWQTRTISSQSGMGGDNHMVTCFGLRDAELIDQLEVYWPGGQITTLNNLDVDQLHIIIESVQNSVDAQTTLPDKYSLDFNYPNPFNPTTMIPFALPEPARVTLRIFDVRGRELITLSDQNKPAGWHQVEWNGTDGRGAQVSSGIYLYKISAAGKTKTFIQTRKMIFLK